MPIRKGKYGPFRYLCEDQALLYIYAQIYVLAEKCYLVGPHRGKRSRAFDGYGNDHHVMGK